MRRRCAAADDTRSDPAPHERMRGLSFWNNGVKIRFSMTATTGMTTSHASAERRGLLMRPRNPGSFLVCRSGSLRRGRVSA